MLDLKVILADPDETIARLRTRSPSISIDELVSLGQRRRETAGRFSELRHEQKEVSSGFARSDMPPEEKAALRERLKVMSDEVKALETQQKELEEAVEAVLATFRAARSVDFVLITLHISTTKI